MAQLDDTTDTLRAIDDLEKVLHSRAERPPTAEQEEQYARLRRQLVTSEQVKARLPKLILSSPNLTAVWGHLREHQTWQARRQLVTESLEPVRAWLEGRDGGDDETIRSIPDSRTLLHTTRLLLESEGHLVAAGLLVGASGSLSVSKDDGTLHLRVPLERITAFGPIERCLIVEAARRVLPHTIPWYLASVRVDPTPQAPPDENEPLPGPMWKPERAISHDGLWFRSRTEIRIYEALKKRAVFFFVNASGVLGGRTTATGRAALREPDFLVCLDGKWGILEVMGEHVHTNQTAPKDHDRARLFKQYGIRMIEFYDAKRCYDAPEAVVEEFLALLARS